MRWENRERKIKRRRSEKNMGKPFRRERRKDSISQKKLSKYFKQLRQSEERAEEEAESDNELY